MNYMRTALLLAAMTALFGVIGLLIGGATGMMMALVVAAGMNLFSYWNSDKLALRAHNAHEVDDTTAPELVAMVRQLAERAQMPMPRVYVIDDPQPNAFATGRNPENAAVAATTGIMQQLTWEELAGVMAHELAHIRNHDTLTMTITATLAGAISTIANFGMFFGGNRERPNLIVTLLSSILAPMAAMVVQMTISRTREYAADRLGAEICGNPMWLATGLQKIAGMAQSLPNMEAERHPATAHMFIVNPLTGQGMDNLFSTHPNPENRIAALVELARTMGVGNTVASPAGSRRGPWG